MGRKLRLSDDLERAILAAVLSGRAEPNSLAPDELSKTGRAILTAVRSLETPTYPGVLLHLTEVQGFPKESAQDYLSALQKTGSDANASEILQSVRDKQVLVEVINSAQDMLSVRKGPLDLGRLDDLLRRDPSSAVGGLSTVAERVKDGLPDPPRGLLLKSLPLVMDRTGGVYGSWVIGGLPKLGKTGVAWQISLDASSTNDVPVLYYDLENSFSVMMDHTRQIFKDDLKRIREATRRIYHRDSMKTLEADLARVAAPALIVVDHIQRLTSSVQFQKASLDRQIHRLDALKKRGYTVLMISEISRAFYNADASMGAYKESGEIEYAAETGLQLLQGPGETIEVHVVANRHRPFRGMAALLQRYNGWAFKEVGETPDERPID